MSTKRKIIISCLVIAIISLVIMVIHQITSPETNSVPLFMMGIPIIICIIALVNDNKK